MDLPSNGERHITHIKDIFNLQNFSSALSEQPEEKTTQSNTIGSNFSFSNPDVETSGKGRHTSNGAADFEGSVDNYLYPEQDMVDDVYSFENDQNTASVISNCKTLSEIKENCAKLFEADLDDDEFVQQDMTMCFEEETSTLGTFQEYGGEDYSSYIEDDDDMSTETEKTDSLAASGASSLSSSGNNFFPTFNRNKNKKSGFAQFTFSDSKMCDRPTDSDSGIGVIEESDQWRKNCDEVHKSIGRLNTNTFLLQSEWSSKNSLDPNNNTDFESTRKSSMFSTNKTDTKPTKKQHIWQKLKRHKKHTQETPPVFEDNVTRNPILSAEQCY